MKAQVRLFEKKLSIETPFSAAKKEMVDLGELLVAEGFAVRESDPFDENATVQSEKVDFFSNCGSNVALGQTADFLGNNPDDDWDQVRLFLCSSSFIKRSK